MSEVLVVLTHYKRPENLSEQLAAFSRQTYPVDLVIVDNGEIPLESRIDGADDVYSFRINRGPSCRFVAPLMDLDHKYTLLYDDDAVPGPGAVEHLVSVADRLRDSFSELGVVGRNFVDDEIGRLKYRRKDVARTSGTQWVHMIGRAHFFKTSLIGGVLELRRKLARCGVDPRVINGHDDLLCLGMSTVQLRPTLIGHEPDGCRLIDRELPDEYACHRRDGFIRERNEMLKVLQDHKVIR